MARSLIRVPCLLTALLFWVILSLQPAIAIPIDLFQSFATVQGSDGAAFPRTLVLPDSSALGGVKKITLTAELAPSGIAAVTGSNEFFNYGFAKSEDVGSKGTALLTWDGDPSTPSLNPNGLGGYDLSLDGATKFRIALISIDHTVSMQMTIYSGTDVSSTIRRELVPSFSSYILDIPFSAFDEAGAAHGSAGSANVQHVTAIQIALIGQTTATDLMIQSIDTDGECTLPATQVEFMDVCGVCNGNGTSCLDCSSVPFGPNMPGCTCQTDRPGECLAGIYSQACVCEPLKQATPEICDQRDNNCDGGIDEGFTCGEIEITKTCTATTSGLQKTLLRTFGRQFYAVATQVHDGLLTRRLRVSEKGRGWKETNNILLGTTKRELQKLEGFQYEYSDGCTCSFRKTTSTLRTLKITLNRWKRLVRDMIKAHAARFAGPGSCNSSREECRKRVLSRIWERRYYQALLIKVDRSERQELKRLPSELKSCL